MKTTPIEDDLKIFDVEYLSNHWSDLIQIVNISKGGQTKVYSGLKLKMTAEVAHICPILFSIALYKPLLVDIYVPGKSPVSGVENIKGCFGQKE